MEVLAMDMERGLLMLRPNLRLMPGLDMVDSMATVLVWAMAAMVMEVLATDMARGPLMLRPNLRPTPGSDMVDSMATVLVWAMAAMAMEVLAMDMERGLLMLRPNLRLMPGLDMVTLWLRSWSGLWRLWLWRSWLRIWKESADAEADAWYGYGGLYGYGLPAYGGYGYGLWGK